MQCYALKDDVTIFQVFDALIQHLTPKPFQTHSRQEKRIKTEAAPHNIISSSLGQLLLIVGRKLIKSVICKVCNLKSSDQVILMKIFSDMFDIGN